MTNFVLVHGAAHGAWCWDPMVPFLMKDTRVREVLAVDLVGHGKRLHEKPHDQIHREDYIQDVVRAIEERGLRDVVLVGHSNAGTIIPQAATRVRDRLKRLVFVSAAIPPEGKTIQQVFADLKYSPSRPGAPMEQNYRRMFCNDMDEQSAQWLMRQITPEPAKALAEPVSRPGFPTNLPLTYVLLKRDEALTPAVQRVMAANLNIHDIPELDAGHDAMVSYPNKLAQVLLRYA